MLSSDETEIGEHNPRLPWLPKLSTCARLLQGPARAAPTATLMGLTHKPKTPK